MLTKQPDKKEKRAQAVVLYLLLAGIIGVSALFFMSADSFDTYKGDETMIAESGYIPAETEISEKTQLLVFESALPMAGSVGVIPKPLTSEFEIIDSYYQYANGYAWEDMFIILLEITRTSPCLEGNEPAFSLFTLPGSDRHFLSIGYRGEDAEHTEYHLYTVDCGFVYELLVFNEPLYYSPSLGQLYLTSESAVYTYSPHVLLKSKVQTIPEDVIAVPAYSLVNKKITAEKLYNYVTEFNTGGVQ